MLMNKLITWTEEYTALYIFTGGWVLPGALGPACMAFEGKGGRVSDLGGDGANLKAGQVSRGGKATQRANACVGDEITSHIHKYQCFCIKTHWHLPPHALSSSAPT